MLADIIDSKTDSAVLSFFLVAPPRSFSLSEVSKRLRIKAVKTARALGRISALGPITSFSKKGKKYYILNSRYKLLPEIKKTFNKNGLKYKDELFFAIKGLGNVKAAFLSGVFCGFHHRTPQEAVIQGVLEDGIEKNWCKTCLLAVYAHC